jgi:hypothetical protein
MTTMTTSNTMSADLAGMIAAIAPGEVDGVYFLDAAEFAPHVSKACVYGMAFPHADAIIRQALIDRGEWYGPQPIIVLDFERMRNDAAAYGWDLQQLIWCVTCHEVAHITPRRFVADVPFEPTRREVDQLRERFIKREATYRPAVPWGDGHGLEFTRRALHLGARAQMSGWGFPATPFLCAGFNYELSPAMSYLDALDGEPQRMRGATLAEIEATEPPAEFTQLFNDDTARYFDERT